MTESVTSDVNRTFVPQPLPLLIDRIPTPIGQLMIAADGEGNLRVALFAEDEEVVRRQLRLHYGEHGCALEPAANPHGLSDSISRYFAGDLNAIDTIPVKTGGTPFQREVWRALRDIACGATISYGQLAQRIGRPAAVRAVGLANGANPIAVIVPCHRVIGSNGSLTGYGGGIERKRWLLDHENRPNRLF
jgi:methylated-DNA-[protein]-cysteine S-methyltransferase